MRDLNVIDRLIRCLADGKFHSGETLAAEFKLTRAAIWKQVSKLKQMGLQVDSVRGRGYRIRKALDLLDHAKIESALPTVSLIHSLEVHTQIESTSQYLKQLLQFPECRNAAADQYFSEGANPAYVCLAEYQASGRGRRGREWHAGFGSSLCFSILWRFEVSPVAMSGLSLALGVAMIRALREYGIPDVGLKWPNDLYWGQQKLGGILFEVFAEQGGDGHVIAGIGLNLDMDNSVANKIDQPWTDLAQAAPQKPICRNTLAATLLSHASLAMQEFSQTGFEGFREEWKQYDVCNDKTVCLHRGNDKIMGIGRGVDLHGRLILDTEQGTELFASGEVSLRLV